MKSGSLPVLLSPRRHPPLAATKPDPRAVSRVTDAAGWVVRRPVRFEAAI